MSIGEHMTDNKFEIVPFHGDSLHVIRDERGAWVAVTPICDAFGVSSKAQARRLKRQTWAWVTVMVTHDVLGRDQPYFCVHLKSLPMWLATIEPGRVRPEVQPKLSKYQCEAADVLAAHFIPKPQTTPLEPGHALHGARIGDTPEGRLEVLRAWQLAAYGTKASMQRVGGRIRSLGQCLSPYRVALCDWPVIARMLHEMAMGGGALLLPPRKATREDPRQLRLVQ